MCVCFYTCGHCSEATQRSDISGLFLRKAAKVSILCLLGTLGGGSLQTNYSAQVLVSLYEICMRTVTMRCGESYVFPLKSSSWIKPLMPNLLQPLKQVPSGIQGWSCKRKFRGCHRSSPLATAASWLGEHSCTASLVLVVRLGSHKGGLVWFPLGPDRHLSL